MFIFLIYAYISYIFLIYAYISPMLISMARLHMLKDGGVCLAV